MSMGRRTAITGAVVQTVTIKRMADWDIAEIFFLGVSCRT